MSRREKQEKSQQKMKTKVDKNVRNVYRSNVRRSTLFQLEQIPTPLVDREPGTNNRFSRSSKLRSVSRKSKGQVEVQPAARGTRQDKTRHGMYGTHVQTYTFTYDHAANMHIASPAAQCVQLYHTRFSTGRMVNEDQVKDRHHHAGGICMICISML